MFHFHSMTFRPQTGALEKDEKQVILRPKTAQLLDYLIVNRERLVGKDELLDAVWPDSHVGPGSLMQSIQELRRELGDDARNPQFIKTFPRRGYQWIMPLEGASKILNQRPEQRTIPNPEETPGIKPRMRQARRWAGLLAGIAVLAASFFFIRTLVDPHPTEPPLELGLSQQWAVLPFHNSVSDRDWQWLASVTRDLIVADLNQRQKVRVLSNPLTHELLQKYGLNPNPTASDQPLVEQILQDKDIQALLTGKVSGREGAFQFDFAFFRPGWQPLTGSIPFSNPTGIHAALFAQLPLTVLETRQDVEFSTIDEANHDYFRGKDALEREGVALSKRYLEAALLRDPGFLECKAALARALFLSGDLAGAAALYREVESAAQQQEKQRLLIEAHLGISSVDWRLGRLLAADKRLEEALLLARKIPSKAHEARILRLLAWHAMHRGFWKKHDALEQEARALSTDYSDQDHLMEELYYLGATDSPLQDYVRNRHLLLMALQYYQEAGKTADLAFTHLAIARNRATTIKDQHRHFSEAHTLFQKLNYSLLIPGIYEGFAMAAIRALKVGDFRHHIEKSLELNLKMGLTGDEVNSQFLLAIANFLQAVETSGARKENLLLETERWLQACTALHRDQEVISRQGGSALIHGAVALERGQLSLAEALFNEAHTLFSRLEIPEGMGVTYVALANLAIARKQDPLALEHLHQASVWYPERPSLWQPYAILANLRSGQYRQAQELAQSYLEIAPPLCQTFAKTLHQISLSFPDSPTTTLPDPPNLIATYFLTY